MNATVTLNDDEQFFYDNAGWAYDPKWETPEHGKAVCAILLAKAERTLKQKSDVTVEWEYDPEPWDGDVEWDGPVYVAIMIRETDESGREILSNLGGIAMTNLDDPYRRVIEAELALESL